MSEPSWTPPSNLRLPFQQCVNSFSTYISWQILFSTFPINVWPLLPSLRVLDSHEAEPCSHNPTTIFLVRYLCASKFTNGPNCTQSNSLDIEHPQNPQTQPAFHPCHPSHHSSHSRLRDSSFLDYILLWTPWTSPCVLYSLWWEDPSPPSSCGTSPGSSSKDQIQQVVALHSHQHVCDCARVLSRQKPFTPEPPSPHSRTVSTCHGVISLHHLAAPFTLSHPFTHPPQTT